MYNIVLGMGKGPGSAKLNISKQGKEARGVGMGSHFWVGVLPEKKRSPTASDIYRYPTQRDINPFGYPSCRGISPKTVPFVEGSSGNKIE